MAYPFNVNNVPLTDIFEPYTTGTKAAVTGYTIGGQDLKDIFAPLYLGSSAGTTGYKVNGADLNTIFAAKGTVSYTLPINGQDYTRNKGRGTASITVTFKNDGTYSITTDVGTVLASGTWLPAGDVVSDYAVQYSQSGAASGPDPDGGSDNYSNGAFNKTSLSGNPAFSISASAITVNTNASNSCALTIRLYKNGTLRLNAACGLDVSAAG
jgi:hypothetical protein